MANIKLKTTRTTAGKQVLKTEMLTIKILKLPTACV
jgi:hypothetical protein